MTRRRASATLVGALLLLCGVDADAGRQPQAGGPLVLLVGPGDYPGETYTDGPAAPAEYVFFEGEAVRLDVRIANWGSSATPVLLPAAPGALASATLTDLGPPQAVSPPAPRSVELTVDPQPWRETAAETVRPRWAARLELGPADALRWRMTLPAVAVGPGVYRIELTLAVTDGAGQRPRAQRASLVFEVRSRGAAEPAELARRAAEWLAADGAPGAYAATEALARVYPDSVVVHLIRSRLADAAGDAAGARRELDAALAFMRTDRDTLFRRHARPGQIEDLIDSLLP